MMKLFNDLYEVKLDVAYKKDFSLHFPIAELLPLDKIFDCPCVFHSYVIGWNILMGYSCKMVNGSILPCFAVLLFLL